MRDFKGMKRQRGRNRKPGGGQNNANNANPNRSWDSQGPENIKVRGNAQTVYERYLQLGRDATASGDRVLAENYLQHAEHYFRVLRALQPARPVSEIAARELSNQGYDIDFEDETGAQAAAFLAAQQAAEKAAQAQNDRSDSDQNRSEGGQREWRDRDQNRDRDRDQQPRAEGDAREGEEGQGGQRRETRRERWERRREERNRRFQAEGGVGDAPDNAPYDDRRDRDRDRDRDNRDGRTAETSAAETSDVVAEPTTAPEAVADEAVAPAKAERPRRTRAPRETQTTDDGPSALPGFLTRSAAPAAPAAEPAADGEAPAPKKRAPRRKVEAAAED